MVFDSYDDMRSRIKWRCPRIVKGINPCAACAGCSPSPYGRTIYTKPEWDLRIFTKIPRDSIKWKNEMKKRTAAERINNRTLHNYGIENAPTRGKKRISFFLTLAAINIHLDAQLKFLTNNKKFDLYKLLHMEAAA